MNFQPRLNSNVLLRIAAVCGVICTADVQAAALFIENFNAASINSHLTLSPGASWTSGSTGVGSFNGSTVMQRTGGSGYSYVQTVDTDYSTIDFRMQLTYTQNGGGDPNWIFIGMGDTTTSWYGEATTGIYLRNHTDPYQGYDGYGIWSNNAQPTGWMFGLNLGNGIQRMQIEKVGSSLTFSVDRDFNGTFVADVVNSFNLAAAPYNFFNATNSRLFFGTGSANSQYDDLSITDLSGGLGAPVVDSVPEPASLALLGLGLAGLAGMRRKVR